jgi:hypothetical protein
MSAFEDIARRSPSTVRQLQQCGSDEYDNSLIICPEALTVELVAGTLYTTSRVKIGDAASSTLDSMQEVSIVCRDSSRLVLKRRACVVARCFESCFITSPDRYIHHGSAGRG